MKTLKNFISDYDDYKKGTLYQYRMVFQSINKNQTDYLVAHFQDYSGEQGLAIVELSVSKMPNDPNSEADVTFEFSSTFDFLGIFPSLIGKEQFLSNIWYDNMGMSKKLIRLYTDNGSEYAVEISKRGAIYKSSSSAR